MAEEIVIDKSTFFGRLSSFYTAWKADRRSGHTTFGGVGSIIVLMGKTDEANSFQKNNAMHVREAQLLSSCFSATISDVIPANLIAQFWLLGYEFPATLLVFTIDVMYVVTTAKKGEIWLLSMNG